jgi:hypothetical protein
MALTKVSRGLMSTSIVDNGNATAITIDSSENVGIGGSTITDANLLNIQGSGASKNIGVVFNDTNTSKIFSIQNGGSALKFFDYTASAERMRIDSSGILLVGKPATGIATVGAELKATGELLATVNSDACAFLNRKTSDGDIAVFRKDNTTVGSIGTSGGKLDIDGPANNSGLRFHESSLIPKKNDGVTNGEVDLGYNDGSTILGFRNLTLSGGVYLGGTGAANKLDDYEEGTFTPTLTGSASNPTVSYVNQIGKYTKVGNLVTVFISVRTSNFTGGSGDLQIDGLPFAADGDAQGGSISFFRVDSFAEVSPHMGAGSSRVIFLGRDTTGITNQWAVMTTSAWSSANPTLAQFSVTYFTTA